ncbi:AMP-binding protein [Streptomyces sp. NBC_00433]
MWRQVLESDSISPADNFFEVGGDSVSALRVVHGLAADGLTISLRDFYLAATVEGQARRIAEETAADRPAAGAPRVPERDAGPVRLPLTPLQSVMAVEALRRPDSEAYWLVLAYALPAWVGAREAAAAWEETVRANPVLRTRISVDASGPFQVIGRQGPPLLPAAPQEPTSGTGLAAWCRARSAELRGAFLTEPLRAYYLPGEVAGQPCAPALVVISHHALMDGWSMESCVGDFHRRLAAPDEPLAERASGAEYLSWLEETGTAAAAAEYWNAHAVGAEPAPELPFAHRPDASGSHDRPDPRTWDTRLPGDAAQGLSRFARRHALTRASVLTALWLHILRGYQDSADVSVGLTVNNRPAALPGAGEASGFLLNTLPLRMALTDDFAADCRRVLEKSVEMAEHAHVPYSEVVEAAGLPGMTRLFTSTLVFENYRRQAGAGSVPVRRLFALGSSADELSLTVDLEGERPAVCVSWDAEVYDREAVEALVRDLAYWSARLEEVDPAAGLVTPLDASHALSGTPAAPRPWRVADLLAAGAADRPAVVHGSDVVSWGELRRRAAVVARWLSAEHGVGPGDRVALVGDRGPEGVVALCAVWLLGAAWCPVSPSWPAERRERALGCLRPKAELTLAAVGELTAGQPLPEAEAEPDPVARTMPPESAAYFVATSGSTGAPKIVVAAAGGLRPVVDAWLTRYGLAGTEQRVLQFGSWTSDVFLGDVLKAMATGGTLVICPDRARVDLDQVERLVRRWRITLLESTPVVVSGVVARLSRSQSPPPDLVTLIVGADTFRLREAEETVARLWDGVTLYNGYGLSEATIESLVQECRPGLGSRSGLCPIGRPLPGTAVAVVDGSGRPVPYGAVGELVVSGAQVGLGYLTEDGLGVGDRFTAAKGVRTLRTGDLVRYAATGELEFHGRRDGRTKVRGHRVELGEIEDCLLRLPGVEESFVFLDDQGLHPELVAFVGGAGASEEAVREGLARLLPEYAVPGRILVEESLPRGDSGKLDRVRMRGRAGEIRSAPVRAGSSASADAPAPGDQDELAARMVELWSKVLERPVSPDRSFFDQGGNSIRAMTLHARMSEALPEYPFPIAHLFAHPTITDLCRALRASPQPRPPRRQPESGQGRPDGLALLKALERGELDVEGAMRKLLDEDGERN